MLSSLFNNIMENKYISHVYEKDIVRLKSFLQSNLSQLYPAHIKSQNSLVKEIIKSGRSYKDYGLRLNQSTIIFMEIEDILSKMNTTFSIYRKNIILEKNNIPIYTLELSPTGHAEGIAIIEHIHNELCSANLSVNWCIVKYSQAKKRIGFISYKNYLYGTDQLKYSMTKILDVNKVCNLYHDETIRFFLKIIVIFPDDFVEKYVVSVEDIEELRASVMRWIENCVGEYYFSKIFSISIITNSGFKEFNNLKPKSGNLIEKIISNCKKAINDKLELVSICDKICDICGCSEIETRVLSSDKFERFDYKNYCVFCEKLLDFVSL